MLKDEVKPCGRKSSRLAVENHPRVCSEKTKHKKNFFRVVVDQTKSGTYKEQIFPAI